MAIITTRYTCFTRAKLNGLIAYIVLAGARAVAESLAKSFGADKIPRLVVIDGKSGTVKVTPRIDIGVQLMTM